MGYFERNLPMGSELSGFSKKGVSRDNSRDYGIS